MSGMRGTSTRRCVTGIRTNPAGMGINWVDSAEVSFRLIAWCWALAFFRQSPVLTPDLFTLLLDTIRAHAAHVERYLSYYDAPNIRLTAEALGLFYVGMLFPELRFSRTMAHAGIPHSGGTAPETIVPRRHRFRTVHVLPPLHDRYLSSIPDPREHPRHPCALVRDGEAAIHAGLPVGPAATRWNPAAHRRCGRRTASAALCR